MILSKFDLPNILKILFVLATDSHFFPQYEFMLSLIFSIFINLSLYYIFDLSISYFNYIKEQMEEI